jgi:hypothetical protein
MYFSTPINHVSGAIYQINLIHWFKSSTRRNRLCARFLNTWCVQKSKERPFYQFSKIDTLMSWRESCSLQVGLSFSGLIESDWLLKVSEKAVTTGTSSCSRRNCNSRLAFSHSENCNCWANYLLNDEIKTVGASTTVDCWISIAQQLDITRAFFSECM